MLLKAPADSKAGLNAMMLVRNYVGKRSIDGFGVFAGRLALEEPGKDGGRRVLLLTDRPIGFSEATNRPVSIDYPFTVIDMQFPPKGYGQGTLAIAA